MKIRSDFVTNSSSVSYGVATVQAAKQIIVLGAALGITSIDDLKTAIGIGDDELPQEVIDHYTKPDYDFDWDDFLNSDAEMKDKMSKISSEIDKVRAEWEAMKDSLADEDKASTKDGFDKYISWLESLKDTAVEIAEDKVQAQLEAQIALEDEMNRLSDRVERIINIKDDIEYLKARIKGHKQFGEDTSEMEAELKSTRGLLDQLEDWMGQDGIKVNYDAPPRDPITPDPELLLEKMERAFWDAKLRAELNADRKAEIRKEMARAAKDYADAMADADFYKTLQRGAETVQIVADVGVDVLEKLTGPGGVLVKRIYVGAKGLGGGVGNAMADSKNAGHHLIKGLIKGGADVAKEMVTGGGDDKKKALIQSLISVTSDTTQGAYDGLVQGKEGESLGDRVLRVIEEGGRAAAKSATGEAVSAIIKEDFPMPNINSRDFGDSSVSSVISLISRNNRSSQRMLDTLGEVTTDSVYNQAVGQYTNHIKGDGAVSSDFGTKHFDNLGKEKK